MKFENPQISWHSRDPVLSIDFQPSKGDKLRLASGGTDSHVYIWYITYQENKSIKIKFASDLYRHNKSVNVVRFSPNGDLLASGDDEGALFLWKLKETDCQELPNDEENINQEEWYPFKSLRGHLEDIYDISWSADSNFLVSASMDNTAILWDAQKFQRIHNFSDSKGYVQGVAYDPLNVYVGTIGTDRILRIININSRKTAYKIHRARWTVTTEKGTFRARLFYDDTLKSYVRRLSFTPDGELLIVPSGILEKDDKSMNSVYLFSRHSPSKPVAYLPTGDKYTIAVRCNPLLFKLRKSENKENQISKPIIDLPYRIIFAVAACDSVIIYDTEQLIPMAYISNIHYTHLTDLTWSSDGRILVASSTDGYCSFMIFSEEELGEIYVPPTPPPSPKKVEVEPELETNPKVVPPEPEKKAKVEVSVKDMILSMPVKNVEIDDKLQDVEMRPVIKPVPISPKESSPSVVKVKKPKVTIESFFKSPKTSIAVNKSSENKLENDEKLNKESSIRDEVELSSSKKPVKENTAMEVDFKDESSIEIVCELVKPKEPLPSEDPKCKLQLNFHDKINEKPIGNTIPLPDLNDDIAVSSFSENDKNVKEKLETENDWKLELSQDEELLKPMDTSEPTTSEVQEKVEVVTTPKPKRRINLITLSKTVSKTPTK